MRLLPDGNGWVIADSIRVEPVSTSTATAGLYYIHNDHLGTPKLLTDAEQNIVWEIHTTPFGEVHQEIANGIANIKAFPGQYRDSETGLSYNYYRDYDPSIGRYVQSDPIGFAGGLNTYGYVGGNPISYVDPNGLAKVQITLTSGQIITATNPGASGLSQMINGLPEGSISAIEVDGHGNRTDLGLGGGYNDDSSIHNMDGRIGLSSPGYWVDLEPILSPKLASRSRILLRGCNTARWNKNLANALSQAFPTTQVTGYMGFGLSNDEIYGQSYGGDFRWGVTKTYLNGEVVDSWNVECECEW